MQFLTWHLHHLYSFVRLVSYQQSLRDQRILEAWMQWDLSQFSSIPYCSALWVQCRALKFLEFQRRCYCLLFLFVCESWLLALFMAKDCWTDCYLPNALVSHWDEGLNQKWLGSASEIDCIIEVLWHLGQCLDGSAVLLYMISNEMLQQCNVLGSEELEVCSSHYWFATLDCLSHEKATLLIWRSYYPDCLPASIEACKQRSLFLALAAVTLSPKPLTTARVPGCPQGETLKYALNRHKYYYCDKQAPLRTQNWGRQHSAQPRCALWQ